MKTGVASLPLHYGSCPAWLFPRMKLLAGAISEIIIDEFGINEFLKRLSNPYFFQSFGCVIGFDWHSSGLTTTVCGALKEALNEKNLGLFVAGGKGQTSRKAPSEIGQFSEKLNLSTAKSQELVKASKLSAKVDNGCVQDGYQLYHHVFVLTETGKWAVIQQGMSSGNRLARRYHWLSDNVVEFVKEPHTAICCDEKKKEALNMTAKASSEARKISVDLVNDGIKNLQMPEHHHVKDELKLNVKTLQAAKEIQPKSYEELILVPGFGAKHIRALALISNLVYGAELSWRDPANYSFAHGGKDRAPYPIDRQVYDGSVLTLQRAIEQAKIGSKEKLQALKRLKLFYII